MLVAVDEVLGATEATIDAGGGNRFVTLHARPITGYGTTGIPGCQPGWCFGPGLRACDSVGWCRPVGLIVEVGQLMMPWCSS